MFLPLIGKMDLFKLILVTRDQGKDELNSQESGGAVKWESSDDKQS